MKYAEFESSITGESSTRKRLFAFVGEEEFLRSEGINATIRYWFGGDDPGVGLVTFWGPPTPREIAELPLGKVRDELETPAFLSARKMVIIRRADAFCDAHGDALAELLDDIPETTALAIESARFDKRKKAARKFSTAGALVECGRLWETKFGSTVPSADSPLGVWIQARARRRSAALSADAVLTLIELCGNDLGALDDALERVALHAAKPSEARPDTGGDAIQRPRVRVDADEVETVVGAGHDYALFQLSQAIEEGRVPRAFELLEAMFTYGVAMPGGDMVEGPGVSPVVLAHLGRELEKLVAARDAVARGENAKAAAEAAGVRANRMDAFLNALRRNDRAKLLAKMRALLEADIASKTGGDNRAALERAVLTLTR